MAVTRTSSNARAYKRSSYNPPTLRRARMSLLSRVRHGVALASMIIMAFFPMLVLYFWSSCTYDECRILGPAFDGPQSFWEEVNCLRVWVITNYLYILDSDFFLNLYPLTLIYDHWPGFLVAANCYGYSLTFFTNAKAYLFPCGPQVLHLGSVQPLLRDRV
ncbi:hypothetical protein BJ742DRAFT_778049 [Cladochytrium replicatum]|nr:hypothetical protein BJ742DRAFT_778049 [Cladochytrium replicatum]